MGETIRLLAIDDNAERISKISDQITERYPEIKIEHPLDFKSLIQLIETNSYDCVISPNEFSQLNRTELLSRLSTVINLPIINYLGDTRLLGSSQEPNEHHSDQVSNDDKFVYRFLVERIKDTLRNRVMYGEKTFFPLPDTPKVVARGKELYIVYEDGSEEFWGLEAEDHIEEIANQMEMELRAVKWVKSEILRFLGGLTEIMKFINFPTNQIPIILFEGYRSILFIFKTIDESINRS